MDNDRALYPPWCTSLLAAAAAGVLYLSAWATPAFATPSEASEPAALAAVLARDGLPAGPVATLLAQIETRGVSGRTVANWTTTCSRLGDNGIPLQLPAALLLEGLAQGAPLATITDALAAQRSDLLWAKDLIENHVRPPYTPAAALQATYVAVDAALRAGLARADLEALFGRHWYGLERFAALAELAGNLGSRGLAGEEVVSLLSDLDAPSASPATLQYYAARIAQLAARRDVPLNAGVVRNALDR